MSKNLIAGNRRGRNILEEISPTVDPDYRYKFVDDLTILEKVNILVTGLTSFNIKASVPSDIPTHNQYIPRENLNTNIYLKDIEKWTDSKKNDP